MKTETSTPVQREAAPQRNQAANGRTAASDSHNGKQPFAQLLAELDMDTIPEAAAEDAMLVEQTKDTSKIDPSLAGGEPNADTLALVVQNLGVITGNNKMPPEDKSAPEQSDKVDSPGRTALGVGNVLKDAAFPTPGEAIAQVAHDKERNLPPPQALLANLEAAKPTETDPDATNHAASADTIPASMATKIEDAGDAVPTDAAGKSVADTTTPSPKHDKGAGAGLLTTAELQQARTHSAPGHAVSAAAKLDDRTLPPPQTLSLATPATSDTVSWHMLTPGQPGSALRSAESPALVTPNSLSAPVLTSLAPHHHANDTASGDSGQQGMGAGTGASGGSITDTANSAPGAGAPDFAQNLDQAMDSLGAQVSYWASNNIRRATVRLDAGLKDALEVDVRLKDGTAQLDFRTNDTHARQLIQSQAHSLLRDLLAQNGIGLEGLSVSAGNAGGQGNQGYTSPDQTGWTPLERLERGSPAVHATDQALPSHRPRQSNGLDVFA